MTTTVNVSNLSGAALDWAVLVALYGRHDASDPQHVAHFEELRSGHPLHQDAHFSTNWSHGGPIIEREMINLRLHRDTEKEHSAFVWVNNAPAFRVQGPTPLVAAMRCYVASKLGDTVEVPDSLIP